MLEYMKQLNVVLCGVSDGGWIKLFIVLATMGLMLAGFNLSVQGSSNNDDDNDNSGSSEGSREQRDGGFSHGYDDGEEDARQDYINGENFDDSCSFEHSNSYCLGYKSGYRVGWTAAQFLH
jgi:hypothetical protein